MTADGMRISDWSSVLCSSDLGKIGTQANGLFALDYPDKVTGEERRGLFTQFEAPDARRFVPSFDEPSYKATFRLTATVPAGQLAVSNMPVEKDTATANGMKTVTFGTSRSEEHTSELQSLMRISYAVFCLKKNT